MSQQPAQKDSFNRERWLESALEALSHKAMAKFSLDSLISAMPVTKGSFYSHFRNRSDFLLALVQHWDRIHTRTVAGGLAALPAGTSPQEKLWVLMRLVHERKMVRYELLIRSMAREFVEISDAVRAVDQRRFAVVRGLFSEMGFEGDELDMRTLVVVTVTSQDHNLLIEISREAYERQLELRHAFFVRP